MLTILLQIQDYCTFIAYPIYYAIACCNTANAIPAIVQL
ncbi:hypothetical protein FLA_2598 [Filimonas lacunae]|nr:hypothetical protein FLA_2598 [Filimonas lacunae]